MTVETLVERVKAFGLPVAKNQFDGTIEDPVPDPPYLVYLLPHERGRGADNLNNLKETDFDLELYTREDDKEREKLEKGIEKSIFPDVEYDKYVAPIPDEECYQTAYEVRGILSKTKGEKDA